MDSLERSSPGPLPPFDGSRSVDLLAQAQAGDDGALNELIERYHERLLRIVRIRLGSSGGGLRRFLESADVVQETWRAALRGLQDLRVSGDADLLNWLARVATNEVRDLLDRVRAQRRSLERERLLDSASRAAPADSAPGPSEDAARTEIREILDEAIAALSEDYREVVLLRDYCGADWETITAHLGRPTVHATQQLHQRAWIQVRRHAGPRLRDAGG